MPAVPNSHAYFGGQERSMASRDRVQYQGQARARIIGIASIIVAVAVIVFLALPQPSQSAASTATTTAQATVITAHTTVPVTTRSTTATTTPPTTTLLISQQMASNLSSLVAEPVLLYGIPSAPLLYGPVQGSLFSSAFASKLYYSGGDVYALNITEYERVHRINASQFNYNNVSIPFGVVAIVGLVNASAPDSTTLSELLNLSQGQSGTGANVPSDITESSIQLNGTPAISELIPAPTGRMYEHSIIFLYKYCVVIVSTLDNNAAKNDSYASGIADHILGVLGGETWTSYQP